MAVRAHAVEVGAQVRGVGDGVAERVDVRGGEVGPAGRVCVGEVELVGWNGPRLVLLC